MVDAISMIVNNLGTEPTLPELKRSGWAKAGSYLVRQGLYISFNTRKTQKHQAWENIVQVEPWRGSLATTILNPNLKNR